MAKIILLMGKSASGKDSVMKRVLECNSKVNKLISTTTRPMRKGEVNHKDYHFVSDDVFDAMEDYELFIETREYNTASGVWRYGKEKEELDLNSKNIYISIVDIDGAKNIIKHAGKENVTCIYLKASPIKRFKRSISRDDMSFIKVKEVLRRLIADRKDFKCYEDVSPLTLLNNNEEDLDKIINTVNILVVCAMREIGDGNGKVL